MKNKVTKHDEKELANFLRKHHKDDALSLLQTKGFLFSVVCCPDRIAPSEWIPLILEKTTFSNEQEVHEMMQILMALYNQINNQILRNTAKLPKECRILPDTMSNFADSAPIHQWSQGFMKGYSWLSESWENVQGASDEERYAFNMNIMVLGIAADRQAFENAFPDKTPAEQREMAQAMLGVMPEAIKSFAQAALIMRGPAPYNSPESGAIH